MITMGKWLKGVICDVHPTVEIGEDSYVWSFAVIGEGVKIGNSCVIGSGTYIGKKCLIGDNVRIQSNVFIPNGVIIEDDVFIGPGAILTDDNYPIAGNKGYSPSPPYLEEGCSIGAGAIILSGVRIGAKTMIGAGAVVTKNVSFGLTVVGCPARLVVKTRKK